MELTIALIISIISVVITVSTFVLNRKDKAVNDTKDSVKTTTNQQSNQQLIEYRLSQVEKKLDKIIDILDNYDREIDERIEKTMKEHIRLYLIHWLFLILHEEMILKNQNFLDFLN